jgi:hypothetical protein
VAVKTRILVPVLNKDSSTSLRRQLKALIFIGEGSIPANYNYFFVSLSWIFTGWLLTPLHLRTIIDVIGVGDDDRENKKYSHTGLEPRYSEHCMLEPYNTCTNAITEENTLQGG